MKKILPFCFLLALAFPAHAGEPDFATKALHRVPDDKRMHAGIEAAWGVPIGAGLIPFVQEAEPAHFAEGYFLGHRWQRYVPARRAPSLLHRTVIAGAACMSIGVGKEAWDEVDHLRGLRPSGADPLDLAYDAAGCAVGLAGGAAIGKGISFVATPRGAAIGGRF